MGYYSGYPKFNGTDLSTIPYIKFNEIGLERQPEVILATGKLVRKDGAKLFNKEFGSRVIEVSGLITSPSRELFLTSRNTLLRYLTSIEKTLQVPYIDNPIEFTATSGEVIFSNTGGGYGVFTIPFICSDPFGYDRDARTIVNGTSVTTASSSVNLSEPIAGYYRTPATITITISSITGGTAKYIQLTNTAGDAIKVTRDWSSNDQLVLNMKTETITVNGTAVDYTGNFWDFAVGDSAFTYADDFTTRTVSILATYHRRYL